MASHFKDLVGLELRETFLKSYKVKAKNIFEFFHDHAKKNQLGTIQSIAKAKGALRNETPDVPGLVIMVMNHFGEDCSELLIEMEVS